MSDTKPKLIIFSGAGLSADSGIPTFRGKNGLWEGHSVDVVANGYTWKENFDTVRNFYNERRANLANVEPNAMHQQIALWQKQYTVTLMTQNIDDLLERAGCQDVIHLHGKLTEMKCEACGTVWDIGYSMWGAADRCQHCNSLKGVRPHVVFFNELAPEYQKMYKAFKNVQKQDCILVIGTSGQVINLDPFLFNCLALKILNNLETSLHMNESYFDHVLHGKAVDMVQPIDDLVVKYLGKNEYV